MKALIEVKEVVEMKTMRSNALFSVITIFFILLFSFIVHSAPTVVTSIKPIHSLASQVTLGITTPILLFPDGQSPHTYLLKPSDRKQIQQADLIIWVGPQLETNLEKIAKTFAAKTLTLTAQKDMQTLPSRTEREFIITPDDHHHEHTHEHAHKHHHDHKHSHDGGDPHIWLSINNAKSIINHMVERLIEIDPQNAQRYQENASQSIIRLNSLAIDLKKQLTQANIAPFMVFHDAYQYFEKDFSLKNAGTILINPHIPLSAKSIHDIKQIITKHQVQCVYFEPEFNASAIQPLLNNLGVVTQELDPLGVHQAKGPDCYESMMRQIALHLEQCQNNATK